MSPKNALLVAAAACVLGLGVYLFIQVRSTPAQAGETPAPRPPAQTKRTPEVTAEKAPEPAKPDAPPVPGETRTTWERTPSGDTPPTLATAGDVDERKVNLKNDSLMELANKAYDSQDFDQAIAIAGKVLSKDPANIRMLRIMVSANCIQGDSAVAQEHYTRLPKFDREQMKQRCDRYGVIFKE